METERLQLRPFAHDLSDLDALHEIQADPEHMRFYPIRSVAMKPTPGSKGRSNARPLSASACGPSRIGRPASSSATAPGAPGHRRHRRDRARLVGDTPPRGRRHRDGSCTRVARPVLRTARDGACHLLDPSDEYPITKGRGEDRDERLEGDHPRKHGMGAPRLSGPRQKYPTVRHVAILVSADWAVSLAAQPIRCWRA
jgi:hypothetical protein